MHNLAIGAILKHDGAKFLLTAKTSTHIDRDEKVRRLRRRWRAKLTCRDLNVLLTNGVEHISGCQAARGKTVRIKPDAHGVVAGAYHLHVADTGQTRQL